MLSACSKTTLNNGLVMPLIGLGTFLATPDEVRVAIPYALDAGYRHIDTAAIYRNESAIGEALKDRGIKREDLFITSKVPPSHLSFDGATESCLTSLKDLEVDYLDLLLIHWPSKAKLKKESSKHAAFREGAWEALETLYAQGKCKAIGVSNYTLDHLIQMESYCQVMPAVNQVECHPYLQQKPLREWCKKKGILVEAYTSLGQGELLRDAVVKGIAAKHSRTPAQVLLRWGLQSDLAVIPKSVTKERIESNIQLYDFSLDEGDMNSLATLERNHHYCWDPTDIP